MTFILSYVFNLQFCFKNVLFKSIYDEEIRRTLVFVNQQKLSSTVHLLYKEIARLYLFCQSPEIDFPHFPGARNVTMDFNSVQANA